MNDIESRMMQRRRIILANRPRLVRQLLGHAIRKHPELCIVAEVSDLTRLPSAVEQTEADWIVVTLPQSGDIPAMLTALLAAHRSVCILAVAADATRAKVRCLSGRGHELEDPSLAGILAEMRRWPTPARSRGGP